MKKSYDYGSPVTEVTGDFCVPMTKKLYDKSRRTLHEKNGKKKQGIKAGIKSCMCSNAYSSTYCNQHQCGLVAKKGRSKSHKSDYIFDYENDITTKRIYTDQSDAVKLSMVETHSSITSATYAITDADGNRTLGYTYDLAGNITEIREGNVVKNRYTYDGHGRLLTETDFTENVQHKYVYNSTGNIKAHWIYDLDENGSIVESGAEVKYFTHTNTDWSDQMTTFDGQSLTYDNSGNPLVYRDGLTFTWTRGRMLEQVKLDGAVSAYYKYNQEGLRIYKDTADMTTVYEWDNTNLIRETVTYKSDSKVYDIWYLYDGNGEITGFVYEYLNADGNVESQTVYYEKNIQGDVIALLNFAGERIAEYSYDAWGNVIESTCESGYESAYGLNHIGYRGYYRDNETGFYYLQSRYYDAEACRFINADDVNILQSSFDDMFKDNLYIYCNSNPINGVDYGGNWYYTFSDYDEFLKKKKKTQYYGDTSYIKLLAFRQTHHSALISNIKKYSKRQGNLNNYINGQKLEPYNSMVYGTKTIGYNGCEVIATYNLMKLVGKYQYFPMVIAEFGLNKMAWLGGDFGTNPENLGQYFKAHNVEYVKYSTKNKFENNDQKHKYYIVSYWDGLIIHTVAAKKNVQIKNNKKIICYTVYNMKTNSKDTTVYNTLRESYKNKRYKCAYGFD